MGEACGSCAEGRAALGARQGKIRRKSICITLGEPPDAASHTCTDRRYGVSSGVRGSG